MWDTIMDNDFLSFKCANVYSGKTLIDIISVIIIVCIVINRDYEIIRIRK